MRSAARPTDLSTNEFAAWRRTCSESAPVTRASSSATARGAKFLRRNSANSTAAAALACACGLAPPNGKLRDELLDREIFFTLAEAKILIERWRREYNTVRPHSALGYRQPAPAAIMPATLGSFEMSPALS